MKKLLTTGAVAATALALVGCGLGPATGGGGGGASGETIVISGLVDLAGSNVISRVPGLGDIPILGRLFRSDRFRADRSDLVILVTPRVVGVASPENVEAIDRSQRMEDEFKAEIGAPALGRSLFD